MKDNLAYLNFIDSDEKRVVCSALELAERCRSLKIHVSSFLNIREQELIKTALLSDGSFCFTFYGGFKDAQRRVLVVFPEHYMYSLFLEPGFIDSDDDNITKLCRENTSDTIKVLRITCSDFVELSHRDFMGALLSLGIERNTVGDIVTDTKHSAYIFVLTKMAQFICDNLTSVGRTSVKAEICDNVNINIKHNTQMINTIAASLRFDCVISAITGISREKAKTIINQGHAELNYYPKASPDQHVKSGDIISVRGHGKYKISDASGLTFKGKSKITVLKYI